MHRFILHVFRLNAPPFLEAELSQPWEGQVLQHFESSALLPEDQLHALYMRTHLVETDATQSWQGFIIYF